MKAYRSPGARKVLNDPQGRLQFYRWLEQRHEFNETDTIECSDGTKYTVKFIPVHGDDGEHNQS